MKKTLIVFCLLMASLVTSFTSNAQIAYLGREFYCDSLKNEVSGFMQLGNNSITGNFGGVTGMYKHHFTRRWSLEGAVNVQFMKELYGFYAQGCYRIPVNRANLFFTSKFMYNRYAKYSTNEINFNISALWQTRYFNILIGGTFTHFRSLGSGYTEPINFTFGIGCNIRPRENRWNLGLFFRNFDDFYYENWNINWGLNAMVNLEKNLDLFAEFNIRPAGSISQLASKYELAGKLGVKYKWK